MLITNLSNSKNIGIIQDKKTILFFDKRYKKTFLYIMYIYLMEYNSKFNPEYIDEITKDLDFLEKVQDKIYNYLSVVLRNANNLEQEPNFQCFINLLGKIRINLESINLLIPLLKKDVKFKISINILYRCIVDDIINLIYLFYFIDVTDKNQVSLENELNILHKEFLASIIEASKAKLVHDIRFNILSKEESDDADIIIQSLIKKYPSLLKEDGKGILPIKIRKTTNGNILKLIDLKTGNGFLTESTKLKFIEANNFDHYNQLKYLFKYFSQFQHYTPESITLIQRNLDNEIYNYANTIDEVIYVIELCVSLLNFEKSIKNQFEELTKFIVNLKQDIQTKIV